MNFFNFLVVIAYLIKHHGHSLSSGYKFLLKVCPTISPNRNYLNQLDKYSSQCEQTSCPNIYWWINVEQEKEKKINDLLYWFCGLLK
jgi:hypothetical protein